MRVLLIEDNRMIGAAVRDHVSSQSHAVDWAENLALAQDYLAVSGYDLVLLDLGLPDGRGIDLLRELRRKGASVPVVILSAQDQIAARIEALNSGADDYLTKPFDLSELSARIAAVTRRVTGQASPEQRFGPLTIDATNFRVSREGAALDLSSREWAVLTRLIRNPGATVSKSDIEEALYALGAEVESNTVEVYVSRLRKKLGHDAIRTLRGIGYSFPKGGP